MTRPWPPPGHDEVGRIGRLQREALHFRQGRTHQILRRRRAKGDVEQLVGDGVAIRPGRFAEIAEPLEHDHDAEELADRSPQLACHLADERTVGPVGPAVR